MADGDDTAPATGAKQVAGDDLLGDAGKRALQAERERARKAEADAKLARKDLEDLKASSMPKSEMDKVLQKLADMEKRSTEAERKALLASVKATTGLSDRQVAKLEGESVDDLLADATETFGWKPKSEGDKGSGGDDKKPATTTSRPPREKLTPNPGQNSEPEEMDPIKLAEMIPRF